MPDIGFGEILVIVVLALLVFGPDRLPKVAADAARTLRQARRMAAAARKDLVDASGIRDDEEMAQTVRDLRELDPRNVMKEPPPNRRASGKPRGAGATGSGSRSGTGTPAGGSGAASDTPGPSGGRGATGASDSTAASGERGTPDPARTPPTAAPGAGAAAADPDWT